MKQYPAITIVVGNPCCRAAETLAGQRTLTVDAPRLPLIECTLSEKCKCRYLKYSDRRADERRLFGTNDSSIWSVGDINRRKKRNRRLDEL